MAEAKQSNRILWLILAVCAAPVMASYFAYYVIKPEGRVNYGELLVPSPAPDLRGSLLDGQSFSLAALKGKWTLLHVDSGACASACQRKLYATRQARTMQNTQADRVVRVWIVPDTTQPALALLAAQPGLQVVRAAPEALHWLPTENLGRDYIYLVDPLGNLMMRFPADPDIKALNKDLARLLKASRIG